jgi:hypothetical protein
MESGGNQMDWEDFARRVHGGTQLAKNDSRAMASTSGADELCSGFGEGGKEILEGVSELNRENL